MICHFLSPTFSSAMQHSSWRLSPLAPRIRISQRPCVHHLPPLYTLTWNGYKLWTKSKPVLREVTEVSGLLSMQLNLGYVNVKSRDIKMKIATLSVLHSISFSYIIVRGKWGYWSPGSWMTASFHSFCLHQNICVYTLCLTREK